MTQEEKARAYDEALNKAKIEINTKGIGEAANLCYQLFPQLAKSDDEESEDDRIRKELKEAFEAYDIESTWNGIPIRSIFAWLEKLAKSKRVIKAARRVLNIWLDGTDCPDVPGDFTELEYAIREYDGDEKLKEQKQAQTSDEKEYVRTIKSIISDFIRDKKPENLVYYQRIYDWLDGRHVPFSCGHENDKPAEWSAEDEEMLDYVISDVNDAKQLFTTKEAIDLCDEEIAWLKSLRPSWKPSEEQMDRLSWKPSEEQMDRLSSIVAALRKDYCDDMADFLSNLYADLKKL